MTRLFAVLSYHCVYVLQVSRKELMGMDFEGILNFFRVTLPRKFQSEEECKGLFQTMSTYKVSQIHLYIHAKQ